MEKIAINVAKEFSALLGGRYKTLGPHSGEAFYEELLEPRYKEAKSKNLPLYIYLDGVSTYPRSFIDESFGRLGRQYGFIEVDQCISFITFNFILIVDYIKTRVWNNNQ